jgi:hypothetical protein
MRSWLKLVRGSHGSVDGIVWRTEPPPEAPYDEGDLEMLVEAVEALRNAHQSSLANGIEGLIKRLAAPAGASERQEERRVR